jgi:hypothetical protein
MTVTIALFREGFTSNHPDARHTTAFPLFIEMKYRRAAGKAFGGKRAFAEMLVLVENKSGPVSAWLTRLPDKWSNCPFDKPIY